MGVLFTNNAATTLAANLNNSATSIAVTSTSTFPSISGSNYFYATFDDGTNNEVVKVTGISSNTWTIVRAQDNTTARAFSSGDTVELRLNVALLNDALGDAATFARDSFTGDGSDTTFTLSQTAASENNLIVFIEGVFQTQSAYSLSGTTLTFSAAPANGREIIVYSTQALSAGTVTTASIVDANITTAKLAADAVTGAKIADNAIDSEHYTDGSIDLAHMSANSVDSDQYVDASIDTAHITDANITTAKLANDAVTAAKLADDSVVTANITDANVTTAKIADDQITLAKLAGLARGKIIYGDSSGNPAALAVGSAGTVLTSDGTDISWAEEVATNYLPLAGGTMTGTLNFGDNVLARFGTGNDLLIYHDASHSYIEDDGTGDLRLKGGTVRLQGTGGTNLLVGITSGATTLYHNNSAKLATASDGVDITGDVGATTATIAGNITQSDGDYLYTGGGNFDIKHNTASQNIVFSTTPSGGSATEVLRITHDGKLSRLSGDLTLDVAGRIDLSADDNGEIRLYDGSSMYGQFKDDSDRFTIQGLISDADMLFVINDGGTATTALKIDAADGGDALFYGDLQAPGIYVGSTNTSYDFYNNGTSYLNGAVTVDDALTVNGDITLGDASGATITMNDTDTSQEDFAFVLGANALAMRKTSNSNDIMRLDLTNERVGVGMTPGHRFDIKASGSGGTWPFRIFNSQDSDMLVGFYESSSGDGYNGMLYMNDGAGNTDVKLSTNGPSWFNGGNVGIGTASPDQLLEVKETSTTAGVHFPITLGGANHVAGYAVGLGLDPEGAGNINKIAIVAEGTAQGYSRGKLHFLLDSANDNNQATLAESRMVIQDDGKVGIGTTSPSRLLDINSTANNVYPLKIRGDIDNNGGYTGIVFGYESDTTAYEKAVIHVEGTSGNVQPDMHFLLHSGANNSNATISDARLSILNGGNVGIGTVTPAGLLDCNGTSYFRNTLHLPSTAKIQFVGGIYPTLIRSGNDLLLRRDDTLATIGTWNSSGTYTASDERHKENITTITGATAKVKQLRGVTHTWKAALQDPDDTDAVNYGLIAQEVETVIPELVHTDNSDEEYKSVSYEKLVPLLIETIKELEARITTLEG